MNESTLTSPTQEPALDQSLGRGWTGGQYSMFRVVFGLYLLIHFLQLIPYGTELFSSRGVLPDGSQSPLLFLFPNVLAIYDAPAFVTTLLVVAAALSGLLILGWHDKPAAFMLWYLWACFFGRNPLISNPSLPYVGLLLLVHAILPAAPYGSLAARNRLDPGGQWRMRQGLFLVVWVLMAVGYTYSGVTKLVSPSWQDGTAMERLLSNPLTRMGLARDLFLALPSFLLKAATYGSLLLELLFAPLALLRKVRPWVWAAMLGMHLGLLVLIDFADLSLGMVMLHLFTFDPAWIRRRLAPEPELLFYDGSCGLCHRFVRLVLAEDAQGRSFRFAPLGLSTFQREIPETQRGGLPDSVVVKTHDGKLLTRSSAILYAYQSLGGLWRLLAMLMSVVPPSLRDLCYDGIARIRFRLFRRPPEACPLLPPDLRARFLV